MEKQIYSYALAKTLNEKNMDYMDTFIPFILIILNNNNEFLSIFKIQEELQATFSIKIPEHVIIEICNRGKNKNYILIDKDKRRNQSYLISNEGKIFVSELPTERDVERGVMFLADQLSVFINEKGKKEISLEDCLDLLLDFINRNLSSLTLFIQSSDNIITSNDGKYSTKLIVEFLNIIEKSRPDAFKIFTDLLYGSIICTLIQTNGNNIPTTLHNVDIFFDTNTLFSILDLHHCEINRPCIELLNLLKREKCNLYAFNFTVDEMVSVLRGYNNYYKSYWESIEIDSIYSSLKKAGRTPYEVREIIASIEDILRDRGIEIYYTDIKFTNEEIQDLDTGVLEQYKPGKPQRSLNHDASAIRIIENIRKGKNVRKLEKCNAVFISSDIKLAKYCLIERRHRETGSISEVILDRYLTLILWAKNPENSNIPLYSAIAAHSRHLFVNRDVWQRFHQILENMLSSGSINPEQFSLALYVKNIEEVLSEVETPEIVNESYILDLVERQRQKIDERFYEKDNYIKETQQLLAATKAENDNIIVEIERVKQNINQVALKSGNLMTIIIWISVISVILGAVFICGFILYKFNYNLWGYFAPIPGILGILGIKIFNIQKFINDFKMRIVARQRQNLLKKFLGNT